MSRTHSFTNFRGVPMLAVLLSAGDTYGLRRDDGTRPLVADRPLIEFWDRRYPHDAEHGAQFISRYWAETLSAPGRTAGLLLDTGSPDWAIDGADLTGVRRALLGVL